MDAKVKTIWSGGLKTTSIIRGFEVETDKPKNYFGTNTAPAPAEVFAASIGACFVTTYAWCALHKHLRLDEITADVKAQIDNTNGQEMITEITLKIKVWSDPNLKPDLEKCFTNVKSLCPLTNALSVPMDVSIEYKSEKS